MSRSITIQTLLAEAKKELEQAGVETGWRDARLLLAHVLGVDSSYIITHFDAIITSSKIELFYRFVDRRLNHEPISRILGSREFWSLPFKISSATLDPRPDSETLVEAVLKDHSQPRAPLKILDLGTGSGCLLLALLTEYPNACGMGVDISYKALLMAWENAVCLHLQDRVKFVQAYWGTALKSGFDVIVSNPPYISTSQITTLAPEVRLYDPIYALNGGESGLECYHRLAFQFLELSHKDTRIYLEIGQGQENVVQEIMERAGHTCLTWHCDLAGVKRCGVFKIR